MAKLTTGTSRKTTSRWGSEITGYAFFHDTSGFRCANRRYRALEYSMTLNEDQKVHIFCAVLQAVIASATKGDQSLTPGALVKEAVDITKEAITTANSSELLKMT